ncbi:MAG TPA: hypothetical protein VFP83_02165 [Candidatus Limnocylindria bacterium]|nr:hypothetical protein [Candidatus Limnocylindria bacterium]
MAGTERRHAAATLVAGAAAGLVVFGVLVALLLWVASGGRPMPVSFGRTTLGVLGLVVSPIAYAAVGSVLASQVPRNPLGWIFLAVALAIGMMLPVNLLVASVHEALRQAPTLVVWIAWFRTAFGSPVMIPLLIAAALLIPDGRPISRRWTAVLAVVGVAGALLVFATAVDPRGLWSYPTLPNPAAWPFSLEPVVTGLQYLAVGLLVPCIVLAVGAVAVRYRQGGEAVRAQLRWIMLGVAVSAVAALPYLVARFLLEVDEQTGEAAAALAQLGSIAFPIAAAVAISRHRLLDIDILIGRTLVYVPLMAILGGLYSAGIALFQRLFVAMTGETSDLAIVLTILLVGSVFTPLRHGLEAFAGRRFTDRARAGEAAPTSSGPTDPVLTTTVARLVPITPPGAVACPLGKARTVYECLTCPYQRAVVREPTPAIVCQPPVS